MLSTSKPYRIVNAVVTVVALSTTGIAFSADDPAKAQYDAERARCMSGTTGQDQASCLRSAGAAYDSLKQNRLADPNTDFRENAMKRCRALPPTQQADCLSRIDGAGTTSGSVQGGGIVRETVTPTAPEPPAPTSAVPASPAVPVAPPARSAPAVAPAPTSAVPTAPGTPTVPSAPTTPTAPTVK